MKRSVMLGATIGLGVSLFVQTRRKLQQSLIFIWTGSWVTKPNRTNAREVDETLDELRRLAECTIVDIHERIRPHLGEGRIVNLIERICPEKLSEYEEFRQDYDALLWAAQGLKVQLCRHSQRTIPPDVELAVFGRIHSPDKGQIVYFEPAEQELAYA